MLMIYNESKTSWLRANINDKTSKFTTSRTLTDGKIRYLDVLVSNDIKTPDMNKFVSMTECDMLYTGNTSIKFKNKDLKPFIAGSDKYNTDVGLVNISLKGKLIKNITGDRVSVIAYLIAKGELFLVLSIRDNNGASSFEITLHDPHVVADTVYTFTKTDNKYTVSCEMVQVDTAIDKPNFKITHFRPAKPTHCIFVNESHIDNLIKQLKYPESYNIVAFDDGDIEHMTSFIEPLKKNGYKAVTLFVNSANFNGSADKVHGAQYDLLKSNFKIVNILLDNGKVIRSK